MATPPPIKRQMIRATQVRAPETVNDKLTEAQVQAQAADTSQADLQNFSSLVATQLAYYGNAPAWTAPPVPRIGQSTNYSPAFNQPLYGVQNGHNLIFTVGEFFVVNTLCLFFNGVAWFPGINNDFITGEASGAGTGYNQVILLDPRRAPIAADRMWVNYARA